MPKIPTSIEEPLNQFLKEYIDQEIEPEKIHQYLEVRRANLYYDGRQELVYDDRDGTIDLTPLGGYTSDLATDEDDDQDFYDFRINIVRGDGRKYVAVLGNRAPNAKATPDNPEDEEALNWTKKGDKIAHLLYSWWEMKKAHRRLCLGQWKSGTQFLRTVYTTDKERFGETTVPKWGTEQQEVVSPGYLCPQCGTDVPEGEATFEGESVTCPGCGGPLSLTDFHEGELGEVPVQAGEETYANGRVELYIYNALHVTVPFAFPDLELVPWLRLETEEHKGRLIEAFPEFRDQILNPSKVEVGGGVGADTRQEILHPSGARRDSKNLVTFVCYWLRPVQYNLMTDEGARNHLKKNFPDGVKISKVGEVIVDMSPGRLDHEWAICLPEISDKIYEAPLAADHISIQDVMNLLLNIGVETLERGVAWMLADPGVVDFDALNARVRRPAEVVPIVKGQGQQLHEALRDAPASEMSNQLVPFGQNAHEQVREAAGVQRTIFGAEPTGPITAREYEGRRNQAMMQLSNPWDCLRDAWRHALMNGARMQAKHGPGSIDDPTTGEQVSLSDLKFDRWHYEIEETIPITPGQRADRALFLMDKPQIADALEIIHPENLDWLHDLLGLTGLKRPSVEALEEAKETIHQLAQEQPIQDVGPEGEPIMLPSVEPKWEQDSELCVATAKAWCLTPAGRRAAETNPAGYQNVIAWGRAHEEKLNAEAMAMAPPEGGEQPPMGRTGQELPPQPEVPIQ